MHWSRAWCHAEPVSEPHASGAASPQQIGRQRLLQALACGDGLCRIERNSQNVPCQIRHKQCAQAVLHFGGIVVGGEAVLLSAEEKQIARNYKKQRHGKQRQRERQKCAQVVDEVAAEVAPAGVVGMNQHHKARQRKTERGYVARVGQSRVLKLSGTGDSKRKVWPVTG